MHDGLLHGQPVSRHAPQTTGLFTLLGSGGADSSNRELFQRVCLLGRGQHRIASTHQNVLCPSALSGSVTFSPSPTLLTLNGEEIVPATVLEGLLAKPECAGTFSDDYARKHNERKRADELTVPGGTPSARLSYSGLYAAAASTAWRAAAAADESLPLEQWAVLTLRLLFSSMLAYTPFEWWERCWGVGQSYGGNVHASNWRDGRVAQHFMPRHDQDSPMRTIDAMVTDLPGLVVTAKLQSGNDVNQSQLTRWLKECLIRDKLIGRDLEGLAETGEQLRLLCAQPHADILGATHPSTVLVVEGTSTSVHAALGRLVETDGDGGSAPNPDDTVPHPVFSTPSMALQGNVTMPNGWRGPSGSPSWLLVLHAVRLANGEAGPKRALLAGHVVNTSGSLGDGKIKRARDWHDGSRGNFQTEVKRRMTVMCGEYADGASSADAVPEVPKPVPLCETWKSACTLRGVPLDLEYLGEWPSGE